MCVYVYIYTYIYIYIFFNIWIHIGIPGIKVSARDLSSEKEENKSPLRTIWKGDYSFIARLTWQVFLAMCMKQIFCSRALLLKTHEQFLAQMPKEELHRMKWRPTLSIAQQAELEPCRRFLRVSSASWTSVLKWAFVIQPLPTWRARFIKDDPMALRTK